MQQNLARNNYRKLVTFFCISNDSLTVQLKSLLNISLIIILALHNIKAS